MIESLSDLLFYVPVLLGLTFGSSSGGGSSSSSSRMGLFDPQAQDLSKWLSPQLMDPYAKYMQSQLNTPFQMPGLNAAGVFDTQQGAVDQLISQSTGAASSGLAHQGMLRPQASPLAGQLGVQGAAPQYLAQVGQNIQNQSMIPEQVRQQRFQDVANALQQLIALMGGQSSSVTTGSQSSGNFGLG